MTSDDDAPVNRTSPEVRERFRQKVLVAIDQHQLANRHFAYRQYYFFFITQTTIALASSILSFMGESMTNQEIATTTVGILSLVVVFLQTISRECQFGERAAMHDAAVINIKNLQIELEQLLDKRTFGEREEIEFAKLRKQFQQFVVGCKSDIPLPLKTVYTAMESNILSQFTNLAVTEDFSEFRRWAQGVHFKLINEYRFYPLFLPKAKQTQIWFGTEVEERIGEAYNYGADKFNRRRELQQKQTEMQFEKDSIQVEREMMQIEQERLRHGEELEEYKEGLELEREKRRLERQRERAKRKQKYRQWEEESVVELEMGEVKDGEVERPTQEKEGVEGEMQAKEKDSEGEPQTQRKDLEKQQTQMQEEEDLEERPIQPPIPLQMQEEDLEETEQEPTKDELREEFLEDV